MAHEDCLGSRTRNLRLLLALQAVLSPTFLAPGTSFMEGNFSMDWAGQGSGGWFGDDSSSSHFSLFLLLLHQLHIRSSGIRSCRLETSDLGHELV